MIEEITGSADSKYSESSTSCIIQCETVNNFKYGKVLFVGQSDDNTFSVSVRINNSEIIRYCNLKSVAIRLGENCGVGTKIGEAADGLLILEYCTKWKGHSDSPVRISPYIYYKQSVSDIVSDSYDIPDSTDTLVTYATFKGKPEVSYVNSDCASEFSAHR